MKSHKYDDLTLGSITVVSYSLHVLKNKNQGKTSFEGGSICRLVLLICCVPFTCVRWASLSSVYTGKQDVYCWHNIWVPQAHLKNQQKA